MNFHGARITKWLGGNYFQDPPLAPWFSGLLPHSVHLRQAAVTDRQIPYGPLDYGGRSLSELEHLLSSLLQENI